MREKNGLDFVTITNQESSSIISIDSAGKKPGESFEVVLESFNTLSNVKSALKTDVMVVNVVVLI